MQHQQLKWIVLGCVSLFGLGIYYRSLTQQQKIYRKKLQEFEDVYKQSKLQNKKSLKQIMKQVDGESWKIVCLENLKPEYQNDPFKLYQRQISVFAPYPMYKPQAILEHQMGNQFYAFRQGKQKLLCRLNDFHLSANLLKEQRKDVNLFKEKNKLQAIVQTATLTLYPLFNVAIYGKLYYDSNRLSWAIEPFFLTGAFQLPKVVDRFYQQKIQSNSLSKFGIFVGGLILCYFTIVSPLKKWFSKIKPINKQDQGGDWDDMNYFKKKSHITVKGESLLNCEKCRTKNVEIVYECGHLAICVDCHDKNVSKECPLCGKVSKKFMKIYMA